MVSNRITRRGLLGAGAAILAAGTAFPPRKPAGLDPCDLFLFRAPRSAHLVAAVVGSSEPLPGEYEARIHAGPFCWKARVAQSSLISERSDARVFVGAVRRHGSDGESTHNAVVWESMTDWTSEVAVWAEICYPDGARTRVGSPLVASLLAGDRPLSLAYHAGSPDEDRVALTDAVAVRIADIASRVGHVADPRAHGRRLADLVMPDIIGYRPDRPVGFNFASRNGRHPADDAASVAATMLTGAVSAQRTSARFRLGDTFPYFLS